MAAYGWKTSLDIVQEQGRLSYVSHGTKRSYSALDLDHHDSASLHGPNEHNSSTGDAITLRESRKIASKSRIEASVIVDLDNAQSWRQKSCSAQAARVSTPGPSQNPLLSLANPRYGLPTLLVSNFSRLGINSMYPWQSSCLLGRGLLEGERNLVYTAPTGGGKSLVADVLMLKRVIENASKKAILVLPYVSLVQEKLKWLRKAVEKVPKISVISSQQDVNSPKWRRPHTDSIRVVGFFGGSKARAGWRDVDIAVCTMEKVYPFFQGLDMTRSLRLS